MIGGIAQETRTADDVISDMRGKYGLFQILRNGLILFEKNTAI